MLTGSLSRAGEPASARQVWKTDPLGEYRWVDIDGPLSSVADAVWIYGELGREMTSQILVPHWKLCLAVIRNWDTVTDELLDVKYAILGSVETSRWNEYCQGVEIIAIRLHPEATAAILNIRPIDIVDTDHFFRPSAALANVARLAENGAPADHIAGALISYIEYQAGSNTPQNSLSVAAAMLTRESFGRLGIAMVADSLDTSERTLRRRFEQDIGLTPKQYARRIRLMTLLLATDHISKPNWSALAHDFGYFDQAHLIEDTRLLTGLRPTQLHCLRTGKQAINLQATSI